MSAAASSEVDVMPALPVHALSPIHATAPEPGNDYEEKPELGRSASFSYMSGRSKDGTPSMKRTFSDNVLSFPTSRSAKVSDNMQSANKEMFRRASRKTKKRLSRSKFSFPEDDDSEKDGRRTHAETTDPSLGLTRSVTGTIRSLARRSWMPGSRPASPTKQDGNVLEKKRSWSPAKKAGAAAADSIAVPQPVASRSPSPSSRRAEDASTSEPSIQSEPAHSLSSASLRNKSESSLKRLSRRSSISSLKSSASSDRLRKGFSDDKAPPLPPSISSDRLSTLNGEQYRKDPLWSAFRAIEGEFTTFQSKTGMQRAKVLRTSLLPFLTKHADHASNRLLRPEDLDRRVVILNKWWTGLLDMLSGRSGQSITGTDRPAFLEAASQIMMRPEWRLPPFPSSNGSTPQPPYIRVQHSTTTLGSQESDFLAESIYQNVQNIFVQNLLSQMAFVVEKLSMRSAPASLVTFGGKACAYAFFFCPGVADMLVRLWRIPPGTLRRIFAEAGVERGEKLEVLSVALLPKFPLPVRSLAVGSQAALSKMLQWSKQLPPGTEHLMWHGPWTGRWSGRDSDLLFVFTKWYHVLAAEFVPEGISTKELVCIPGFAPVHAQLLTVLETTIYRQAGQQAVDNYASGTAGALENPDAVAPMPMTIANASRQIAENRLVILLRDVLGDRDPDRVRMQELYASSFGNDVKAATRKISLYNNDACFVLCDFLEEIFPIMARHYQHDTPYLDWPFWMKVCRQMMQSHNTLTQIRLIAFVYSTWSILISNETWKRELVLEWLLEPEFFDQHFTHWSPMVRHYYYRLLCWRIGRCDGEPTLLDLEILETMLARLNRSWAHYQYLSAEADMRDLCPPSTVPCSPAPSRSLVIIRTDSQPLPPGAFSSFDKFLSQGFNQSSPYQRSSSILNSMPSADSSSQTGNKKRWSLLKTMLPFGGASQSNGRPGEVTPPRSPDEAGPQLGSIDTRSENPISRPATPPHQAFSFKFSLEWVDHRNNNANRNRRLVAPLLPTNAQKIMALRRTSGESSGSSTRSGDQKATPRKPGEIRPRKPQGREVETSKYSGRALAEWAQVLMESRNFYLRRKQEGVPRDGLVETPVLGVETFRMLG